MHGDHGLLDGLRLLDGRDRRIVPLLAIGQANGRGDLGAGQVLEDLEVLLGFGRVAGTLQRARHAQILTTRAMA